MKQDFRSVIGSTLKKTPFFYEWNTLVADDVTPSVKDGAAFETVANTVATDITDFDDAIDGQIIIVRGGSDTNPTTITNGGNFDLKTNGSIVLGDGVSHQFITRITQSSRTFQLFSSPDSFNEIFEGFFPTTVYISEDADIPTSITTATLFIFKKKLEDPVIFLTQKFNIDAQVPVTFSTQDVFSDIPVWIGAGDMISGANTGTVFFGNILMAGDTTNKFINIATDSTVNLLAAKAFILVDFKDLGEAKGYTQTLSECSLEGYNKGFIMEDCGDSEMLEVRTVPNAGVNATSFTYKNLTSSLQIKTGFLINNESSSLVWIDPSSPALTTGQIVIGSNVVLSTGNNFLFRPARSGSITAYEVSGSNTKVTSTSHDVGDQEDITISGTTNYNNTFTVTYIDDNSFEINTAFLGDDATGTYTGVASENDSNVRVKATDNSPFSDTAEIAFLSMITNATATTGITATPVKVAGIWDIQELLTFIADTTGKITYIGLPDKDFFITINLRGLIATGNNLDYSFFIFKNGVEESVSVATDRFDSSDTRTLSFSFLLKNMKTNDFLELFVSATSSTANITVDKARFIVR